MREKENFSFIFTLFSLPSTTMTFFSFFFFFFPSLFECRRRCCVYIFFMCIPKRARKCFSAVDDGMRMAFLCFNTKNMAFGKILIFCCYLNIKKCEDESFFRVFFWGWQFSLILSFVCIFFLLLKNGGSGMGIENGEKHPQQRSTT